MMLGLYHCVTDMDGARSANSTAEVPCIPLVPIRVLLEATLSVGSSFIYVHCAGL